MKQREVFIWGQVLMQFVDNQGDLITEQLNIYGKGLQNVMHTVQKRQIVINALQHNALRAYLSKKAGSLKLNRLPQ